MRTTERWVRNTAQGFLAVLLALAWGCGSGDGSCPEDFGSGSLDVVVTYDAVPGLCVGT